VSPLPKSKSKSSSPKSTTASSSSSPAAMPPASLPFAQFLPKFVRVPDERTRDLVPMRLHPQQVRFVNAVDLRDPATGLRVHHEFALSFMKKAGKSTSAAALALWALVADDLANDREVIIVASDLAQTKDVIYLTVGKMIERHPWLAKRCRRLSTEIIFTEDAVDPRTGGHYKQDHILRALPRDVRGLHGSNASCLILDEAWAQDDYDLIEALAPSPARLSPITLYCSYAGLRSQRHKGNPWHDICERATAPGSNVFWAYVGGVDGWRQIPWITQRWIDEMRERFATVPSKFDRLVLNIWSTSDSAFVTEEEMAAAVDHALTEPTGPAPGTDYALGVDLGLVNDWTALVLVHANTRGYLIVDAVRTWRGTRTEPVDLQSVQDEIVALAQRFGVRKILIDQWQAAFLQQQLARQLDIYAPGQLAPGTIGAKRSPRHSKRIELVQINASMVDQITTRLKGLFKRRAIRIPGNLHDLIEQLESLDVIEYGKRNRRRDMVRFEPTKGAAAGAASHDDIVMALGLAAHVAEPSLGKRVIPEFAACNWEVSHQRTHPGCFLWTSPDYGLTPTGDPSCHACLGWQAVKAAYQEHVAAGGDEGGYKEFYAKRFSPNKFIERKQWQRFRQQMTDAIDNVW
jgi:hypothetical protein